MVKMNKKTRFRFLQTGDLHVGRGRSSWGEEESLRRSDKLFDELFTAAEEQKCHAILICGDVFDRKQVTNSERELVSRKLTQGSAKLPIYVIPGNHDLKTKSNSNLDYLAEITENTDEIPNLHVSFPTKESIWEAPTGDMPGGLYIVGAAVGLSEDEAWVNGWVSNISGNDRYVFMGHGTVKGCVYNDALFKPREERGVSLASAGTASQVIWWAYGDIHKRQALPTLPTAANGWYAGTPIQMDFGEAQDRGVLIVALDHSDKEGWHYKGRRYVRIDDRGFDPLITVTDEEQIKNLPDKALIRLAKGLVIPSSKKEQIVSTLRVVDDRSLSVDVSSEDISGQDELISLDVFDPLLADLSAVENEVLQDLPHKDDDIVLEEAKKVISLAVDKYRERTYVS